jgi:hypothetical protein
LPSEYFYCPHCRSRVAKTAQAFVLGEMLADKGSRSIGPGSVPEHIVCPICRGSVESVKMLRGEFDRKRGGGWGWPLAAAIVTFLLAEPRFYDGYGWSSDASTTAAAGLAIVVGASLYVILLFQRKAR